MSNDKKNENQNGRRHFSPEDKMKMLRLHLLEKVPISEVCEKHQIIPTQFYQWQKTFFENGAAAFAKTSGARAASQTEQKLAKPCADQSVLPAIQRQAGTLAPHAEGAGHPSQDAPGCGAGPPGGDAICGALQHGASAQRHRLPGAQGQTGRPGRGDLEGAR